MRHFLTHILRLFRNNKYNFKKSYNNSVFIEHDNLHSLMLWKIVILHLQQIYLFPPCTTSNRLAAISRPLFIVMFV